MRPVDIVFILSLLVWVLLTAAWLFPRRMRLEKRLGNLTSSEVIQRGKDGDREAMELYRDTKRCMVGGLLLLLPQVLVQEIAKQQ